MVEDIKTWAKGKNWSFFIWTDRMKNKAAHWLASYSINSCSSVWLGCIPPEFDSVLCKDLFYCTSFYIKAIGAPVLSGVPTPVAFGHPCVISRLCCYLLPWMQHARDFRTLPSFVQPCLRSYEIGRYGFPGHSQSYQLGDYGLVFRIPVLDPLIGSYGPIVREDQIRQMKIDWASGGVYMSLVGLAIHHFKLSGIELTYHSVGGARCQRYSQELFVHPDGIIATSASCLKPLKSTKFEISVKLLHSRTPYKGVLLEADFCSDIAFVKIISGDRQTAVTFGKLDSRRENSVLAAGCVPMYFGWDDVTSDYKLGYLSIDQEMENTESRNERTSGQLIKAEVLNVGRSCIVGPLVNLEGEFFGIIHKVGRHIEATPIDDVFKYLEHLKKHGEHAKEPSSTSE
ncbi:uncharacterized protein LOC131324012 [Rhododendron vialii]|uniref:uncharacterized protein LOC131324012 n=1 Tax=Rhododendron vialii TaxID=182163 RepID=UPI00265FFFA8|nr:uncharacterized protein LOC131324012 [Rhododendron vialii]